MRRGTPFRPLPVGFFLAGMLSMLFTAGVVLVLIATELAAPRGPGGVAARGSCVLLASLGAIATEALWDARPSAYAASLALAAAWVGTVALWFTRNPADNGFLAVLLALSTFVVGPILVYLHRRSRTMWPAPRRVARPRP